MVAALLLVAGCDGAPETGVTPPIGTVTAGFEPGGEADVITVTAVDRVALQSAELEGPGGQNVPAYWIAVRNQPSERILDPGGITMGTPGMARTVSQRNEIVSVASLRLPEPVAYEHTWRDWRVVVRLGSPGGSSREVVLAAPEPPPLPVNPPPITR